MFTTSPISKAAQAKIVDQKVILTNPLTDLLVAQTEFEFCKSQISCQGSCLEKVTFKLAVFCNLAFVANPADHKL